MSCNFCERLAYENVECCIAGEDFIEPNFCPMCGAPLTEPKPLTVEQLRGMDGKSVWVKNLQHGTFSKRYVDCSCPYQWMRTKERLLSILDTDDYGKTWVAYDRKPTDERRQQNG